MDVLSLIVLCWGFFIPYRFFAYILWFLILCFYRISVYANMCVSVYMYFFGSFPSLSLFYTILVCFILFCFIFTNFLDAYILVKESVDLGWRGTEEDLGEVSGGGEYYQNTFY